jgi:cell division protein FtsB
MRVPELQAAVEVGAEEAARLAELSKQLSKETAELAKLRASCDGLQKKAAALQVCRVVAFAWVLWVF